MKRLIVLPMLLTALSLLHPLRQERDLFREAENRFYSEDYVLAVKMYDDFLDRFPLSQHVPDVRFRKAVALYRTDRSEEALALLEKIEQRYRSTQYFPFVPFWKGLIHYDEANYSQAVDFFSAFLRTGTRTLVEETLLYLGIASDKLGQMEEARVYLSRLLERQSPEEGQYAFTLFCSLLIRTEAYEEVLERIKTVNPEVFEPAWKERILLYQGEGLWNTGRSEDAVAVYSRLLNASPEVSSTAYQRLFSWHQRSGNEEELRDILDRAERTLTGRLDVLTGFWLRIGIESFKEKKYDLAKVYLQRIWNAAVPSSVDPLVPLYLSQLYVLEGKVSRGVGLLEEYREASGKHDEFILFQLSGLYLQLEKWAEIEEVCTVFFREFPLSSRTGEVAYRLSFSLYRRGDLQRSMDTIQSALSTAASEEARSGLLRLGATIQRRLGKDNAARALLDEYAFLHPGDPDTAIQIAEIAFNRGEYGTVMEKAVPLAKMTGKVGVLSRYLIGLSLITEKQYLEALEQLEAITLEEAASTGLDDVYPYTLFYRGWALYRLAEYRKALGEFEILVNEYPSSPLTVEALYLAGWCGFSLKEYDKALVFFGTYNSKTPSNQRDRGLYMYAKSYEAAGKQREAAAILNQMYTERSSSAFADDALFEHAGILERLGNLEEAAGLYGDLYLRYPDSPFGEESLFRKAEILYRLGKYREARNGYYQLRMAYPEGSLYDAALHWGAMASLEAGEPFGAVLLWEILIRDKRDSGFRSDALRKTAEVYRESGDYAKAFALYSEFLAVYPDSEWAGSVDRSAEELMYLLQGREEEEADLTVTINRAGGAASPSGREAMIELARLYLYRGGEDREKVPGLLARVIERKSEDPERAARAQYYVGEYYFRKNDLTRAWKEFLAAATMNPADKDLMAMSLFRALQVALTADRTAEAGELLTRLEAHFPESGWTLEARRLMGGRQ